ncbi:MAG: DNA-binding transcriptional regulator GbsR (MarR family) [Flavobacteriales bacterium]|jgi:DNA-binding transcriptional regulator GbsR (MarR family)
MKLKEAQDDFIQSWGTLGSNWGINKTMAQIHALLLVSSEAISADDVMNRLNISRGNANMNLRALIDWALVDKVHKIGERREFFKAEKDMWKVASRIASERRKRELLPILRVLEDLKDIDDQEASKSEIAEFNTMMNNIEGFTTKVDSSFGKMIAADEHWFMGTLLKLVK